MSGEEPSKNPFVRFKKHVDEHISAGIQTALNVPSTFSRSSTTVREGRDEQTTTQPTRGVAAPPQPSPPKTTDKPAEQAAKAMLWHGDVDAQSQSLRSEREVEAWGHWARCSPYSPFNLGHIQQPVPSDLPADLDANDFGFKEVFEDLLRDNSDIELINLRERAEEKRKWRTTAARGEPPMYWVDRLYWSRILPPYDRFNRLPRSSWAYDHMPQSMEEWVESRRQMVEKNTGEVEDKLESPRNEWNWSWRTLFDTDFIINPGKIRRKIEEVIDELDMTSNEIFDSNPSASKSTHQNKDAEANAEEQKSQLQAELDMWAHIVSEWEKQRQSRDRLFDNFWKSRSDGTVKVDGTANVSLSTKQSQNVPEQREADGDQSLKTVKSTSEHTDWFGNRHTKTDIKKLDADGNVVARETYYTVRSDWPKSKDDKAEKQDVAPDSKAQNEDAGGDNKSSGWFWK